MKTWQLNLQQHSKGLLMETKLIRLVMSNDRLEEIFDTITTFILNKFNNINTY